MKRTTRLSLIVITLLVLTLAAGIIVYLLWPKTTPAQNSDNLTTTLTMPEIEGIPLDGAAADQQSQLEALHKNADYQNPRTDVSYDELFRNSDNHIGEYIHYKGKVIQVIGEPYNWNLRVNITNKDSYWQDTVLIVSRSKDRLLENDLIEFTAQAKGTTTYEAVLGQKVTLPLLLIYEQKLLGKVN